MIEIRNLTPHAITFIANGDKKVTIDPSGVIARVTTNTMTTGEINGIPVTTTEYSKVENLPAPEEGVIYLVSLAVAQRCIGRTDIYIPNEQIRNEQGQVIGCRSLGRVQL